MALKIATDILDAKIPDPTGGAIYFITGPEIPGGRYEALRTRDGYSVEIFSPGGGKKQWRFYTPPKTQR
jgi:hypothetical protein